MMQQILFVYITAGSREEAERIGEALVTERLAACVNVLDGMSSMYWWEGKVQRGQEVILIAKTRSDLFPALEDRVLALHSYDCPCVVAWPVQDGHGPFLDWIRAQTMG